MKKNAIALAILAGMMFSAQAVAISKADLIACLRGEQPPSGVACPVR